METLSCDLRTTNQKEFTQLTLSHLSHCSLSSFSSLTFILHLSNSHLLWMREEFQYILYAPQKLHSEEPSINTQSVYIHNKNERNQRESNVPSSFIPHSRFRLFQQRKKTFSQNLISVYLSLL